MNAVLKQKELLFETNSGYHDLTSTTKTVFVSYVLPEKIASGQFYEDRRMIIEEFMAGVNFASESAVLTIEQFWNGVKVQQYVVKPALKGTPAFNPKTATSISTTWKLIFKRLATFYSIWHFHPS